MEQIPASSVQRMLSEIVAAERERIIEQAWNEAQRAGHLVLGFASRKGPTYSPASMICEEKRSGCDPRTQVKRIVTYASQHPDFLKLTTYVIVMDLAQTYYK